jgi:Ribbon-helix-helix protein, copG family
MGIVKTSFRLDVDLLDQYAHLAIDKKVSMSRLIEEVMRLYL